MSRAAHPAEMDTQALQHQLFRYAQDLRELMAQQSALQQRYQTVLQSLGHGAQEADQLLDVCIDSVDQCLVTNLRGDILYSTSAFDRAWTTPGRTLKGQRIQGLMPGQPLADIQALLEIFCSGVGAGAIQQRQLTLCTGIPGQILKMVEALVMQVERRSGVEVYWFLGDPTHADGGVWNIQKTLSLSVAGDTGLIVTDPAGNIQAVNAAFTQITGYAEDEVLGQNPRLLGAGLQDADFYSGLWRQLQGSGSWTGELFNRRKNGQVFLEWMTAKAVKNARGATVCYMAAFSDKSPRETDNRQLNRLAFHDPLTGLPNRHLLESRLTQALAESKRKNACIGLLFIDLDGFKHINEELGHAVGDLVLQSVSASLQSAVRQGDLVARVGGDEFVVLLHSVESDTVMENLANYILFSLTPPIHVDQHALAINASIGCARYPQDAQDMATLLKCADAAMLRAKRFGTRLCFYETGAVSDHVGAG